MKLYEADVLPDSNQQDTHKHTVRFSFSASTMTDEGERASLLYASAPRRQ